MFENFMRKFTNGKPIIVVSGLPRSGTSMLMKMLEAGGADIASDGLRTADTDNPKGYYELERVKELDKGKDKAWVKELRGQVVKVISYLLKDLPEGNRYKVIFVQRDLKEVMASQNKMLVNRGVEVDPGKDQDMIQKYETHLLDVRDMLANESRFEVTYLNHRDILNDPHESTRKLNVFLDRQLNEEKAAGIVDRNLYRNRR